MTIDNTAMAPAVTAEHSLASSVQAHLGKPSHFANG